MFHVEHISLSHINSKELIAQCQQLQGQKQTQTNISLYSRPGSKQQPNRQSLE